MCIAIYKPADKEIDKATLKTCCDNNPDGCGFAYIDQQTGKIIIKKSMKFKSFYKDYEQALSEHGSSPFLIHFRITSHGTTELLNCHPFMIDEQTCFIHNGTISKVPKDTRLSDTQIFNQTILQKLPYGWFHNDAVKTLIEDYIGFSKLIFMNNDGEINIYNENKGEWKDGIWYSNTTYKPRKTYSYTTGGSYGQSYYNKHRKCHSYIKDYDNDKTIKCNLCGQQHLQAHCFQTTTKAYICYDCMEMLDSFEHEIVELAHFVIDTETDSVIGGEGYYE